MRKSKKMKGILSVIAIALVVIAANLTYQTVTTSKAQAQKETIRPFAQEQVVKVLGKYEVQFDGLGATTGFLVESKEGLYVVPFDKGSMAGASASPEYLSVYWPEGSEKPMITPGAVR